MSSHVVSISSISFVCHLNVPEVFFSSNITKSSLITEVPRRYVGRCRGGGIPGIKVVGHCVCVCIPLGAVHVFCCPAFLSNELHYEANICGMVSITRAKVCLFSTLLWAPYFLSCIRTIKSAIWYWGQLCRTSAPHRSLKENNSPNTA